MTPNQSKAVANEYGEKYVQLIYDGAIAKVALQIQNTAKDQFKNLFIHLGVFHIMMAYFKAIGKFIDKLCVNNTSW